MRRVPRWVILYNDSMDTLQVGVKALIKNSEGKFLLVERSSEKYKNMIGDGMWDIPGGRIDIGKSLEENLYREIKEETSLDVTGKLKLLKAQDILARAKNKHVVRLSYLLEVDSKMDGIQLDHENIDYKWVKMEELKSLDDLDPFLSELVKEL